ncbi:MAG: thioesterase [Bacteroidales bacterium]|jgi:acyl-ACP thioesterase|nr:thioesterase [Bacteroidales bacterium]
MDVSVSKDNKYSMDVTIPCYDTDASFFLKPASFMDLCQELAYWAAQKLGFGYDDLKKEKTAWVLSRMYFKYIAPPKWHDDVILSTWHKGPDGPFFLRDFQLKDRDGNVLISATSSWLVIDLQSRTLVRCHDIYDGLVSTSTQCREDALSPACGKLVMPKGIDPEFVGRHKISYSDIDIIGHTNNARYVVWAMDAIDYRVSSRKRIKDLKINFNKETVHGESVDIYKTVRQTDDGLVYSVEGIMDGKSAFCVEITY